MKLGFCELCKDLIVPENTPKPCKCGNSYVWWKDARAGHINVARKVFGYNYRILGIHNGILANDFEQQSFYMQRDEIQKIINETPDNYLFKSENSLIVPFRPGSSGDSFSLTIDSMLEEFPEFEVGDGSN